MDTQTRGAWNSDSTIKQPIITIGYTAYSMPYHVVEAILHEAAAGQVREIERVWNTTPNTFKLKGPLEVKVEYLALHVDNSKEIAQLRQRIEELESNGC